MTSVACIIEGHGEASAAPALIRRIAHAFDPPVYPTVQRTIRVPKSSLLMRPDEFAGYVELGTLRGGPGGRLVVLVDADTECPALLGPELLRRAREVHADYPISVCIAKVEFESWFIAAAESLRGPGGLRDDVVCPPNHDEIRDAKGWLADRMASGGYRETLHQARFAGTFDLDLAAERSASFARFRREIERLLGPADLREGP